MPTRIYHLGAMRVRTGGVSVQAIYGPVLGGKIFNPSTPDGQGLETVEDLFVDQTGPALLRQTATTVRIAPGAWYEPTRNQSTGLWINSVSSGHRIAGYAVQPAPPPTPAPQPGPFPPAGPTSVLNVIPAYPYQQYGDDDSVRAFFTSLNSMTQQQLDWFNEVGLPIYTGDPVAGTLLDWVADGLYGFVRPVLSSGRNRNVGPYNTARFNQVAFNSFRIVGPTDVTVTSDDVFKRIITWAYFKGDGRHFDVRWLKRRIMRFLLGTDGVNYNVDQTYQVSVSLGLGGQVNITLITGVRTVVGGALYNRHGFNGRGAGYNQIITIFRGVTPLPNAAIFKEAVESGALELPFQFSYVVKVN